MAKCGCCGWEGRKACSQWSSDPLWHSSKLTAGHQHVSWATKRFIFSCFYRLCNLNVFGFRIVDSKGGSILTPGWWEFWRRAAHDLLKVILECCIGGPWTLNIKFMIKIGANLSSFIEAKKRVTNVNDQKKLFCETHCRQGCCHGVAKDVGNIFYGATSLGLEFSLCENKRFHSKAWIFAVLKNRNWFWLMKWFISWSYCRQKHPA